MIHDRFDTLLEMESSKLLTMAKARNTNRKEGEMRKRIDEENKGEWGKKY